MPKITILNLARLLQPLTPDIDLHGYVPALPFECESLRSLSLLKKERIPAVRTDAEARKMNVIDSVVYPHEPKGGC